MLFSGHSGFRLHHFYVYRGAPLSSIAVVTNETVRGVVFKVSFRFLLDGLLVNRN